ncbi:5'-deoxynucleotidase [Motilimonas pumila]|uniref:5'-deoxynucleotidase n=1 Tax=Motilimonas pumila TaxID=2303987 RepID=A0A418YCB1_9GAMM|nr:5'-deoxynucleotidase [Motilimonas pumila]RJG42154.1 5'-deoxynucleotidase [Motilimonas pumila]
MSHFLAHLIRMKFIHRWPLMRNVDAENIAEHSHQVAMVAHMLAVIKNKRFDGQLDPNKAATMALYHDASEVITGDLPTPVKYFNPEIAKEYKKIESYAEGKLIAMLPADLQQEFAPLIDSEQLDPVYKAVVKDADTLCAYIKCLDELAAGNQEFSRAKKRLKKQLNKRMSPELQVFIDTFLPSFELTLDEISEEDPD